MRSAQNDARRTERGRDINYRFRGGWTDRVTKEGRHLAGLLFGCTEDGARLRVFLPFAFYVLLGHERLLPHEKQIKTTAGFARFAQSEIESAPGAADRAQD